MSFFLMVRPKWATYSQVNGDIWTKRRKWNIFQLTFSRFFKGVRPKFSFHMQQQFGRTRCKKCSRAFFAFVLGRHGPSILGDFEVPIEHFATVVHRFNVLLLPSNARGKIVSAHNTPGPAAGQNRGAFMFHVHLKIFFSLQPQKNCGAVNVLFAPEFL